MKSVREPIDSIFEFEIGIHRVSENIQSQVADKTWHHLTNTIYFGIRTIITEETFDEKESPKI